MPLECTCTLCKKPMLSSTPGCYPPICHECWITYPDGKSWESVEGQKVIYLLKQEGIIDISSWNGIQE